MSEHESSSLLRKRADGNEFIDPPANEWVCAVDPTTKPITMPCGWQLRQKDGEVIEAMYYAREFLKEWQQAGGFGVASSEEARDDGSTAPPAPC